MGYKGALELSKGIEKSVTINAISMEWNQIGVEGAKAIGSAIRKSQSLKKISLGILLLL